MFGKTRISLLLRVRNRTYIFSFDEYSGGETKTDRHIDLNAFVCVICMVIVAACAVNLYAFLEGGISSKCTWMRPHTIGHSFGGINGDTYTGSLEALDFNYRIGRRTMEADMLLTTDNRLVIKHDWDNPKQEGISEDNIPTEEKFLSARILGKYTPLSFEKLCRIMEKYSDLWIITDTKSIEPNEIREQFGVMLDTVKNLGCEDILGRIIVQVYSEEMYDIVDDIYHFDNYIFTMYQRFYTNDRTAIFNEVCRFCVENDIGTITVGKNVFSQELEMIAEYYGRNTYVHTVNDVDEAKTYIQMGALGVYTDTISENDF